jgi:hypothetical protein
MGHLGGTASAEIDALREEVWAVVEDVMAAPQWTQEKGDMKSVEGVWELEDLGHGRTRASYRLDADPGRMLGLVTRGPVEVATRAILVNGRPDELRRRVESG